MEIYTERLWRNTNFRFKPPSDARSIDGIKSSPVRIVKIDMEKLINATKFVTTKIGKATKTTMNI